MITYINTVPSTFTLNFDREDSKNFTGTAAFTGAKTIAIENDGNADGFLFTFNVTTSCVLTFPSNWRMDSTESRFAANALTLTGTGLYNVVGVYSGANWLVKATPDGGMV
jgi:hypothetical protein